MQFTTRHSLIIILVSVAILGQVIAMWVFQPLTENTSCLVAPADKQINVTAESNYNRLGVLVDQVS